ncbi:MAG: metallophosphoesterase [Planctomycetota bacterium]
MTRVKSAEAGSGRPLTRRRFLKLGVAGASALVLGGYPVLEASWVRVRRARITVPRLPAPFRGLTVAFLSDVHHGPYTTSAYVDRVVRLTNALACDLISLGGDYVYEDSKYIEPSLRAHAALRARCGVYGVLGNHDHWQGAAATRRALQANGIVELTNTGAWLERDGARLRLAGVGDYWEDDQDLEAALGDTASNEVAILLSHNPDYAETISDPRVGLVLSGHTHGGQVDIPFAGAPFIPSAYGRKFLHGWVQAPHTQVFVSRGLGTIFPPLRLCCRPEIVHITLA